MAACGRFSRSRNSWSTLEGKKRNLHITMTDFAQVSLLICFLRIYATIRRTLIEISGQSALRIDIFPAITSILSAVRAWERELLSTEPEKVTSRKLSKFRLIAIMLGRLRMRVPDCIKEYKTLEEEIFGRPRSLPDFNFVIRGKPKYDTQRLEQAFQDICYRLDGERTSDPDCDTKDGPTFELRHRYMCKT